MLTFILNFLRKASADQKRRMFKITKANWNGKQTFNIIFWRQNIIIMTFPWINNIWPTKREKSEKICGQRFYLQVLRVRNLNMIAKFNLFVIVKRCFFFLFFFISPVSYIFEHFCSFLMVYNILLQLSSGY